jgi:hypothetical protein
MSIYPVHIKSFHNEDKNDLSTVRVFIKALGSKCNACKKKVTANNCWANHSMLYIGTDRIWCSEICAYGIAEKLLSPDEKVREWAEEYMKEIESSEP